MNSSALLLIASAFLHAGWNAIAKSSKDKETFLFCAITISNPFARVRGKTYWSWICAVCIAGYHICHHCSLQGNAEPKSLFFLAMIISWPFLIISMGGNYVPRIKDVLRKHPMHVVATGIAAFLSFVIFLYGLKISAPGFAISLRNSSIFFVVLFSFFFRESLSRLQIIGALTIGIGAMLLSIP